MSNNIQSTEGLARVVNLGQFRESKDGYTFDIASDKWVLNKDISITFQSEILSIEEKLLNGFRSTLGRYAEDLSAHHTSNMYFQFQRMVRSTDLKELSVTTILNWKASLSKDHEWYLGALKGFLISWHDFGYYGVTSEIVELLESLTITGNLKGESVLNRCPYTGAYTENEVLAINQELNDLWRNETISFDCYAYINLLQATARRPKQIRDLKACDLYKEGNSYFLNIPCAKKRGLKFRSVSNRLPITEELYLIILNLIAKQKSEIESIFMQKLTDEEQKLIPIFVDFTECKKLREQLLNLDIRLLKSEVLHMRARDLGDIYLRLFEKKQRAISERTGHIIQITARRFRHTRGTNLGRKGIGARIIAEALDHSDSQNVKVYTENTADTVQYIDKAVGKQLAPFAKAFLGRIIEDLTDGERGNDPTAKIPNSNNEAIGACGTNDFCVNGFASCYVCQKFRPLVDAPHEDVLESLYEEKEKRLKTSGSVQFASSRDRLILAVEEVVSKCNEIKAARGEEKNG
ncbi:site-specific integrase [Pseudoalteromonas distincta]|uniref:site-specific integrase n=1 Tax=Pseudoalteromonas distincta TaxID=77608 RepID=UPI00186A32F1|nr:site-specific integrase [Pseudoalteromonas distincta]MBE3672436.1 hypothetical protein [Pseudoalteromonas distincta KMM 3548]